MGAQALNKGLELVIRIDPAIPAEVIGDQLRVRQILFNLVGNAIKFTERGEVRVRANVRPPEEGMVQSHVLLQIEDTGIGIPREKLEEIFESCWQADDSTTRRYGGTGLGTTIARDLARLMGGSIGVESEMGGGSRLSVRLPLLSGIRLPEAVPAQKRLCTHWCSRTTIRPGSLSWRFAARRV
ncbi:MAG: ATP-binding protein [Pseudomonadota bacterium]|nr:ATP-binding protein [Pseudomonadota bacterium]